MQRWAALTDGESALVLLNQATYSIRAKGGLLEAALLRSAVYAAHPEADVPERAAGRALPHLDQGAVYASFRVYGGSASEALDAAEDEAAAFSCPPRSLCAFPDGTGGADPALVRLEGADGVTAMSVRRRGDRWMLRLLNNTAHSANGLLDSPLYGVKMPVSLAPHEIRTYSFDREGFDFEAELC